MTLYQPRRAVLYVPASHQKALAKSTQLQPDAIIYDLEDSVAEQMKHEARDNLRAHFQKQYQTVRSPLKAIRINSLATQWGEDDLKLAAELKTEAIVLPKTETPQQVIDAARKLDDYDAPETLGIWAMIETPRGILNADEIARLAQKSAARLKCFIIGTNDIALSTGVKTTNQRSALLPWMMQIILAARAGGIDVLDGVYNNFQDQAGFAAECEQGAMLGFDGKTLIHPSQIETALDSYSSTAEEAAWANQVIAAFNLPENAAKGAISLNGTMVEQLHIRQAERTLARVR
ncbi:CoA ester lyase [Ochrobactrum sp. SFR4]|uniref:HpcH/HpaI aldolase/citrate lyase family protein n=1 Tax=Ochrobactrum sp. SFR4 TaxID=2717368 RepID=UPI001C8CA3D1|nr:CoA ester lyase [Ochrobactrum sp. SFR4]